MLNQAGTKVLEYKYDYTDGSTDVDQLQSRVTSNAGSGLNGTIGYTYSSSHLEEANNSNGTDYAYNHDNIGNLTSELIGSVRTHFGYDRAGELCWQGLTDGTQLGTTCPATPAGDTTLGQDAAGNNTNTTSDPSTFNDNSQATTVGGQSMGYLDLGNDIRTNAGSASTVNGPLGITALKTGSTATFYTRDPEGKILDSRTGSVTTNYFTEPQNNSVAALYSPSGAKVGSYLYSPYGQTTVNAETGGSIADDNPFRYISGYQDTAGTNGGYHLGARYYDTHSHFTQPDPVPGKISDPESMAAYNYAAGDPINQFDLTGLAPCWIGDFHPWGCLKKIGSGIKNNLDHVALAVFGCGTAVFTAFEVISFWSATPPGWVILGGACVVGGALGWTE